MKFSKAGSNTIVTLYPMVHVGEQAFYNRVYGEAFTNDVVLVEGIKSTVVRHLTRSYRWLDLKRLGLSLQPATPIQNTTASRIVVADLSADEFHQEWRKIPFWLRVAFYLVASYVGLKRHFSSRNDLAENMSLEDLRSSQELMNWDPKFEQANYALLHARDARLAECLGVELDQHEPKRVAIVYGAQHIRTVVRILGERGYRSSDAEWYVIFSV